MKKFWFASAAIATAALLSVPTLAASGEELLKSADVYMTFDDGIVDTNGNYMSLPYMILVSDETAPTLTVDNNLKSTYGVGEGIKIPTYSATDNGSNCYIQVMVILPDSEMRLLHYVDNGTVKSLLDKEDNTYDAPFKADENTFITEKKGRYILRFLAYDEYYNYTVQEITFYVK